LLQHMPPEPEPTLVHGDFYSNNWVCAADRLLAVVDWENASIGPPLLDVAWLAMIHDPAAWAQPRRSWMSWAPSPEQIADAYSSAGGAPLRHFGWYRGLAAWRFGAIIALQHRLHIEGRRPDATWDLLAGSFDSILGRAEELVAAD
jgi:aminoglycoside phosphotransferase (APT) family kinase protein